jgi:hypothetical protein
MTMLARFAALAALVVAAGCGPGGPETGTVSGEVTLNGQPLKEGLIRFVSVDGKAAADAPITDGKFTATVPTGEMTVSISANKVVGKKKMYDTPDSPTVDETIELIPAKYNSNTELKLTVKAGPQTEKYELKGGKAK